MKNHKSINNPCPECKHPVTYMDPLHGEIYCQQCGLVIQDQSIFSIVKYISSIENKEKYLQGLWKQPLNK